MKPKRTEATAAMHWMVRMNFRNRMLCFPGVALFCGVHVWEQGRDWRLAVALGLPYLCLPWVFGWRGRRAADPKAAETQHMWIDAVVYGATSAVLHFPLWISFGLFIACSTTLTAFRSWRGAGEAAVGCGAGALCVGAGLGFVVQPQTSGLVTGLCIVMLVFFLLIVAENAYMRSVRLHEARAQLKHSEQALQQQLDHNQVLQTQLKDQVNRDPLTGVYNRRYLVSRMVQELLAAEQAGRPLCVMMLDVDHFKRVNDEHGHLAGDEVLKSLAALLQRWVRSHDIVCRYGGEEFLLLLPGMAASKAMQRARDFCRAFAASAVSTGEQEIRATVSIGVAMLPEHGLCPDALIKAADQALYQAKSAGRNRVVMFETPVEVESREVAPV